jgi:hypothetical protein
MSRGLATYRKSDLKRGIKALESAGLKLARVEISKEGTIIFFPKTDEPPGNENSEEIKL